MKILIPISSFERAGGFRVLSELASHWTHRGHTVDFLVDARSNKPYFPTVARILSFNAEGLLVTGGALNASFASLGNARSIYLGMLRALNRIGADYDVVLANHSFTALPVALARTGRASKWYYIQAYEPEYYSFMSGWRGRVLQGLSALSYKLPLTQIANAPVYMNYRGIRAKEWIPPGLDLNIFVRRAQSPSFASDQPIVLGTIGRSEATKGTVDVLAAFEQLASSDPRIRLRIAYGNLPDGWQHPRAEIVEPQGDVGLAEYYRSVDILIAPGTVQLGACHYPVLEAMASGTPVITTGYLPADESNAWLVPVNAPDAIADAVKTIVALPDLKLEARLDAAVAAVASFDWAYVSADFLSLISGHLRLKR